VVIASDRNLTDLRFPVQWVIRPMSSEHHDYRGYAGQPAGGLLEPGVAVSIMPSGRRTRITAINTFSEEVDATFPPMSVSLRLADEIDVSHGDVIVQEEDPSVVARELDAMVCWISESPMFPCAPYTIKHATRSARAVVEAIDHHVDTNTLKYPFGVVAVAQRHRARASALFLGARRRPLRPEPHHRLVHPDRRVAQRRRRRRHGRRNSLRCRRWPAARCCSARRRPGLGARGSPARIVRLSCGGRPTC
jgi:hypothetical protein